MNKENVYIDYETYGTKVVSYWVNCFERELTILFKDKDLSDEDIKDIENKLDQNYDEWNKEDRNMCCEEYMIQNLDKYYQNSIVAVIYDNEEE